MNEQQTGLRVGSLFGGKIGLFGGKKRSCKKRSCKKRSGKKRSCKKGGGNFSKFPEAQESWVVLNN